MSGEYEIKRGAKAMRPRQKKLQSQVRILNRRKKVSELYLRRYTMLQIADVLDCGVNTVAKDIKAVKKQWEADAKENIDQVLMRELAEIQHLENEAAKEFIKQRDSKFLKLRLECKDRRAKLLGLDAPEKKHIEANVQTGLNIDLENLTDKELDFLQKMVEKAEAQGEAE